MSLRLEPLEESDRGKSLEYVVLGMHRSATSLVAKGLSGQGIRMGESGPHYEDIGMLRLNDEILRRARGSWDSPPLERDILRAGLELRHRIKDAVESRRGDAVKALPGSPLWGWKDPRTCLTIGCFVKYLNNPFFVVTLRNPIEVAASLARRDKFSMDKGVGLAIEYNRRILKFIGEWCSKGAANA